MRQEERTDAVARDLTWLWFDLLGPYLGGRRELAAVDEVARALAQLEPLLSETARSNRRALLLFVVGAAGALITNRLWLAFVYRVVFPLNDAHILTGDAQYWITTSTMWIQFVALTPALLAFLAVPRTLRLSRALGRVHARMLSLPPEERRVAVQRIQPLEAPRVVQMFSTSARWRRLLT